MKGRNEMPEDTRKVLRRLRSEPERIKERKGKGDHVNFKVAGQRDLITIDTGRKQLSDKAYKDVKRIAGWED